MHSRSPLLKSGQSPLLRTKGSTLCALMFLRRHWQVRNGRPDIKCPNVPDITITEGTCHEAEAAAAPLSAVASVSVCCL